MAGRRETLADLPAGEAYRQMYQEIERARDQLGRPPRRGAPDYKLRTQGPVLKEPTLVPSDTPTDLRDELGAYWKIQL